MVLKINKSKIGYGLPIQNCHLKEVCNATHHRYPCILKTEEKYGKKL